MLAVWGWTCLQLAPIWKAYPNYHFGYAVPWIALLLAVRSLVFDPIRLKPIRTRFMTAGLAAAWALFLFAELERQVDPHWRLVSWAMAFSAALLTALGLLRAGGAPLLRRLAFPLAFLWTAVPWPSAWEDAVTGNLRLFVTRVTVAGLHATGIHALRHGNVVELAKGGVVVDSACSGISSLQCGLMACLFFGEYFRLSWKKRLSLVAAGSLLAVAFNLLRTYLLVRLANDFGEKTFFAHHDQLGYAETCALFVSLILLGRLLSSPGVMAPAKDESAPIPQSGPFPIGWGVLAAFAAIPFLANAWFLLSPGGPARTQTSPRWTLTSDPEPGWSVERVEMDPLDAYTLNFTEGQLVKVKGPGRFTAMVSHFFWRTDAGMSPLDHTPAACMTASGWSKAGDARALTLHAGDADFPGRCYRFEQDGVVTTVFQTILNGGDNVPPAESRLHRLTQLWTQPRRQGVEALTLYVPGDLGERGDRAALQEVLARVLASSASTSARKTLSSAPVSEL